MPMRRPRKRASASSPSCARSVPSTTTRPESGRSSPAMVMSSVDLPEPDGPTRPTASPRAMVSEIPFRIWTRAAPRPRLKSTFSSAMALSVIPIHPNVSRGEIQGTRPPERVRRARLIWGNGMQRHHGLAVRAIVATLIGYVGLLLGPAFAQPDRPLRLVALGDSLTAGYSLPAEAAFPAALERALRARGHNVEVANAGVSGDTASGGLQRVDWSVPDGTDGVILELGANDMLRGLDPAITRQALEGIIQRLRARGIPVLLAGMYASRNLGPDYAARFDAVYRDLARTYGLVLYPFFLESVAGQQALNLPDGLHPTAQGVEQIVQRILPSVESFIARMRV